MNASAPSCKTFITDAKNYFVSEQLARKSNAMEAVRGSAQRVFDADRNSSIALIRSQNLLNAQTFVSTYNNSIEKNLDYDNDVTRRQFEINEYHYHNKLDTLFFLQLFFITVLVMAILIYFNRKGTLTTQMTGILTAILAVILILVGVSRYFYTQRVRDRRLWHRRYFQKEKPLPAEAPSACPGPSAGVQINLNDLFESDTIQCAADTKKNVKSWFDAQATEAANQMLSGDMASSIFKTSGVNVGASCRSR